MNRATFLAAVHEFAEQLGVELYAVVERQAEQVRERALEVASAQLRAQITGEPQPPAAAAPESAIEPKRLRAARRCSKCDKTGHDVRRCEEVAVAPAPVVVSAAAPVDEPEPEPDDDEQDSTATPPSPPPTRRDRFARIEAAASRRRADGA